MVSSRLRRQQRNGLGSRTGFTRLSIAARFISLLILLCLAPPFVAAQVSSTRVEVATLTESEGLVFHVRVLRGQTIESAVLRQGEQEIPLEAEQVPLPMTQWIILDASEEMINLQSAVQSAVQRFLRNNENRTGVIFYSGTATILRPTDRMSEVETFLANYTATAEQPACLALALEEINKVERPLNRSWRILIITAGDFSRQSRCPSQAMPNLPAPPDMIVITDTVDATLDDLRANNNGITLTANLRTVEARVNEIRTLWGQPTYVLRGTWDESWDSDAPMELSVTLSNDTEETSSVRLRDYNIPVPIQPTARPTEIVLATLAPRNTVTPTPTSEAAIVPANPTDTPASTPDDEAEGGDNIALLLIIGAVLFTVGAVVLALALSRLRRSPVPATNTPRTNGAANFYQTLDEPHEEDAVVATRIRERSLINDNDLGITNMSSTKQEGSETVNVPDTSIANGDEEDALIITQVLSDDRFQKMMKTSQKGEVIGWLRLEGAAKGDFELTTKGAVIGRSQECDIQITGDSAISRQHARLDASDTGLVTISRLSGVNPVVVGGIQIGNRHPLKPNDVIHLSDQTRLIFIARQDESFDEESTMA